MNRTVAVAAALAASLASLASSPAAADPVAEPAGTLVFRDAFEDVVPWGGAQPWSTTDWHVQQWQLPPTYPTLVRSPDRPGHAVSTVSAPWKPNPYRTELSPDSPTFANDVRDDVEYVVSLDTYVKRYGSPSPSWMTMVQFHGTPGIGPDGQVDWNCVSGRNPVSLTLAGGQYGVNINDHPADHAPDGALAARDAWNAPLTTGHWVSWWIRLIGSQTRRGVVEVWRDGVLVASRYGRNKDANDSCGRPDSPQVFFKIGTYKEYENPAVQEILFDNVRVRRVG